MAVYFIEAWDRLPVAIKIGYSENIPRRLKELQIGSSRDLMLLTAFPGDREYEEKLHREFRYAHVLGEWFKPVFSLKLYAFIREVRQADLRVASRKFSTRFSEAEMQRAVEICEANNFAEAYSLIKIAQREDENSR